MAGKVSLRYLPVAVDDLTAIEIHRVVHGSRNLTDII